MHEKILLLELYTFDLLKSFAIKSQTGSSRGHSSPLGIIYFLVILGEGPQNSRWKTTLEV